jgi:CRP-like cAMP-binding protein
VELNNYHYDGREFTQGILSAGHSIGESLLFTKRSYPMNACAKTECSILKLPKLDFFALMSQNTKAALNLLEFLSSRLYYKYVMLFNLSTQDPELMIIALLDHLKGYNLIDSKYSFQVPYTRQQLANLTGLRVETVIRTVKKMEKNKIVKIERGKIFY